MEPCCNANCNSIFYIPTNIHNKYTWRDSCETYENKNYENNKSNISFNNIYGRHIYYYIEKTRNVKTIFLLTRAIDSRDLINSIYWIEFMEQVVWIRARYFIVMCVDLKREKYRLYLQTYIFLGLFTNVHISPSIHILLLKIIARSNN